MSGGPGVDELTLVRTSRLRRTYELREGEAVRGILKQALVGKARLRTDAREWVASRARAIGRTLLVRSADTGEAAASVRYEGVGGQAAVTVGAHAYEWRREGVVDRARHLRAGGEIVAEVRSRPFGRERARVVVHRDLPDRTLTLLVACYAALVEDEEASTTATRTPAPNVPD